MVSLYTKDRRDSPPLSPSGTDSLRDLTRVIDLSKTSLEVRVSVDFGLSEENETTKRVSVLKGALKTPYLNIKRKSFNENTELVHLFSIS